MTTTTLILEEVGAKGWTFKHTARTPFVFVALSRLLRRHFPPGAFWSFDSDSPGFGQVAIALPMKDGWWPLQPRTRLLTGRCSLRDDDGMLITPQMILRSEDDAHNQREGGL